MTTGVFYDVPWSEYRELPGITNSQLALLSRSPRHFRFPPKVQESPSLRLGTLTHAAILEPLDLLRRYVVMPDYAGDERNQTGDGRRSSARTGWVREQEESFRGMHAGKEFVAEQEMTAMVGMASAVAANDAARAVLQHAGRSEVTICWTDRSTGLLCKGRIDRLGDTIGDLKTCVDLKKFVHSYRDFAYYRQMAYYVDGYATLTGQVLTPWIVAVEKTPPHCTAVAPVHADDLEQGRVEYRELLRKYQECQRTREWPGPPSPDYWRLPDWARRAETTHYTETETEVSAI